MTTKNCYRIEQGVQSTQILQPRYPHYRAYPFIQAQISIHYYRIKGARWPIHTQLPTSCYEPNHIIILHSKYLLSLAWKSREPE